MTAYINKLKDVNSNQQLPVTHERAVRDDNGTTAETKFQNLEGAMDKTYVANSDNGMGRITLHKNMVSEVNTLTQSMMQATNTIYVIRYDFTLGEDITIPANCILEFEGGKLSSGTITLNNTLIINANKSFSNITFAGTSICNQVLPSWFDGDNQVVQAADFCNSTNINRISLDKSYEISREIVLNKPVVFEGNSQTISASSSFNPSTYNCLIYINSTCRLRDIILEGNLRVNDGILIANAYGICQGISIRNLKGCGVNVVNASEVFELNTCYVYNCKIGIRFSSTNYSSDFSDIYDISKIVNNGDSFDMITIKRCHIINTGIALQASGNNLNFLESSTGHNQLCALQLNGVYNCNIKHNKFEGDGVCVSNPQIDNNWPVSGLEPVGDTSASLISSNLDGNIINGWYNRSVFVFNGCYDVHIDDNQIQYKKRGNISNIASLSRDRTKAGIDSIVTLLGLNEGIKASHNSFYNWNAGSSSDYSWMLTIPLFSSQICIGVENEQDFNIVPIPILHECGNLGQYPTIVTNNSVDNISIMTFSRVCDPINQSLYTRGNTSIESNIQFEEGHMNYDLDNVIDDEAVYVLNRDISDAYNIINAYQSINVSDMPNELVVIWKINQIASTYPYVVVFYLDNDTQLKTCSYEFIKSKDTTSFTYYIPLCKLYAQALGANKIQIRFNADTNSSTYNTFKFGKPLIKNIIDSRNKSIRALSGNSYARTYGNNRMFFDSTLGKPIYWNGSAWVDATGTPV